jgi:single-strand DNA-binding protein
MSSVNKAIVIGFVGKDPDIRTSPSGAKVASLSIATSESWKDKATGERKERTHWHRVVIFNEGLVKVAEQYVKKGARLYVEGSMRTRAWKDNAGIERHVTEVVLGPFGSALQMLDRREGAPSAAAAGPEAYGSDAGKPEFDDEIPFS